MRVHHLNCITSCPLGGALMDGHSRALRGRLTCHCLLVEAPASLVLVDTGFGLRDVADPPSRISRFFLFMNAPEFREEMTAVRQIQRMGFDPRDVRHIVLSHLDFDHAGGLDDFPQATVHMLDVEREAALARRTMLDKMRYRPQQWSTRPNWRVYTADEGERWNGFARVAALDGVPPEIVMVPLRGHTFGHAGIAVRREQDWLLQAADAYFYHDEMNPERPHCTPGLRFYQWMMQKDKGARMYNQERLRELVRTSGGAVKVVSSHDPVEFERVSGRRYAVPAGPVMEPALV